MEQTFRWEQKGREFLELSLEMDKDKILSVKMKAIGCLAFLKLSQEMKKSLQGSTTNLKLPKGTDHSSLIWQEILLQIKGLWKIPVDHKELCHCRKVDTAIVDRAIVYGAHEVETIRKRTSANTGCGTCKEDVEKMIHNRMKTS